MAGYTGLHGLTNGYTPTDEVVLQQRLEPWLRRVENMIDWLKQNASDVLREADNAEFAELGIAPPEGKPSALLQQASDVLKEGFDTGEINEARRKAAPLRRSARAARTEASLAGDRRVPKYVKEYFNFDNPEILRLYGDAEAQREAALKGELPHVGLPPAWTEEDPDHPLPEEHREAPGWDTHKKLPGPYRKSIERAGPDFHDDLARGIENGDYLGTFRKKSPEEQQWIISQLATDPGINEKWGSQDDIKGIVDTFLSHDLKLRDTLPRPEYNRRNKEASKAAKAIREMFNMHPRFGGRKITTGGATVKDLMDAKYPNASKFDQAVTVPVATKREREAREFLESLKGFDPETAKLIAKGHGKDWETGLPIGAAEGGKTRPQWYEKYGYTKETWPEAKKKAINDLGITRNMNFTSSTIGSILRSYFAKQHANPQGEDLLASKIMGGKLSPEEYETSMSAFIPALVASGELHKQAPELIAAVTNFVAKHPDLGVNVDALKPPEEKKLSDDELMTLLLEAQEAGDMGRVNGIIDQIRAARAEMGAPPLDADAGATEPLAEGVTEGITESDPLPESVTEPLAEGVTEEMPEVTAEGDAPITPTEGEAEKKEPPKKGAPKKKTSPLKAKAPKEDKKEDNKEDKKDKKEDDDFKEVNKAIYQKY
jgi:hypothetical protein